MAAVGRLSSVLSHITPGKSSSSQSIPSSILIVGSGVFGLSTAYALAQRLEYGSTAITVLDRVDFPAPDAASIDSSRIIRADYADYAYAALMTEGKKLWHGEWGAEGRYNEPGLAIVIEDGEDGGGKEYMRKSLENVQRTGLKVGQKEDGGQVTVLESSSDCKKAMGTMGGSSGQRGYVNWTSGWADAEAGMRFLREKCSECEYITFRTAEISRLLFGNGNSVEGVELTSGEHIKADLTMLATGAWTPKFLDMRGLASASGQILAYLDITPEEQARLSLNPTLLNESTGMFIIPPKDNVLKVARHGYGYANPTTTPHPERPDSDEQITVSLPRTKQDDPDLQIPKEGQQACRSFLQQCIPDLGDRPFSHTRICWYSDTPKGDWLIDYHPQYRGLFVATGGSGHAYKFVPVVGERIVDIIAGKCRDELGEELRGKWSWPMQRHGEDHIWTNDWRGGRKGMILNEELARS